MPSYKITYSNELYHFGIPGMKWGVRRFQRKDGTLTTAGKKRRATLEKFVKPTLKNGKDKEKISPAEKITKESQKILEDTSSGLDAAQRLSSRKHAEDLSSYSDEELRRRINRIQLERQYSSLKSSDLNRGFETAKDVLSVVGSVVGVTAGVLGIVSTLKNLKG